MRKLFISLSAIFGLFIGISIAAPSVLNPSYTVNGDDVKIYRTDNSNGGYMDINLQDPETNDWLHFGEVKISDEVFSYTKQRQGNQKVQIIPGDGGDNVEFTILVDSNQGNPVVNETNEEKPAANRTVIPAVPRTGSSSSIMWIIAITFIIFGGYIYVKRKADI